jgi:hypothetical protein
MAFTEWSAKSAYFNAKKNEGCSGCNDENPCSDCNDCDDCKDNGCGCCPPGLVEVRDPNDDHVIGCLTPNDAEGYFLKVAPPPTGYVRLVVNGVFLGFVTVAEYLEVNPS